MMPPPPRRYLEPSGPEIIEPQPYRQRELSRRPVEVEYRPQYEDIAPPRDYVPSRAYSLRPEVVRREAPQGYVRHESIQPALSHTQQPRYREVSIVHQEPIDDRRYYSAAPQTRRYVEEEPIEVLQEPFPPEPRRYTRY
jgi:hypothetical protein